MDLALIRNTIVELFSEWDGWNVYPRIPKGPKAPAIVVGMPTAITVSPAQNLTGMVQVEMPVHVLLSRGDEAKAQQLFDWLLSTSNPSGPDEPEVGSVINTLHLANGNAGIARAWRTCRVLTVSDFGSTTVGTTDLLVVDVNLELLA